jgi:hypothetical protein
MTILIDAAGQFDLPPLLCTVFWEKEMTAAMQNGFGVSLSGCAF